MSDIPRHFSLKFLGKQQVAKEIFTFSFDTSQLQDFTFLPGQFIRMTLDLPQKDPRSNRRYFTISSSPLDHEKITITTKITKNPSIFKQKLFSLRVGEEVQFWGPSGSFILPEDETVPLVFLSGGMGITPFHSMLAYLSEKKSSRKVTLLASFSTAEEMVFSEELGAIGKLHSTVNAVYTLSQPQESWKGERGRITKELLQKHCPHLSESIVYVSGPIPFVKALIGIVKSMGVTEERIKEDNFPGY